MKVEKKRMEEALRAFSDAMEEGGPEASGELAEKRRAYEGAREEYLNADAAFHFCWGYLVGREASRKGK